MMVPKKLKSLPSGAQLQLLTDEITERSGHLHPPEPELEQLPEPEPITLAHAEDAEWGGPPFGSWLVKQHQHKRDWIAELAKAAKADHRFPKAGSVDQVREYLTKQGADGDAFEALDDAETEWLML